MKKQNRMTGAIPALRTCLLAVLFLAGRDAAGAVKPNILMILADDLGYGDVSCYNPRRGKISTPNIDRLAAQGFRFTDAHSSSGVCSPSRYALLTGRYHWRTGKAGIVGLFGPPMIAAERLTLPRLLQQHGYRTAAVGKWHLGWNWPIPPGEAEAFKAVPGDESEAPEDRQRLLWQSVFSRTLPGGPTTRGFQSYFGTDVPNWPPYCFIENDRTIGIPSVFLPKRLIGGNMASLQGPALPGWMLEDILPALADRACDFLRDAARRPEPFFLYLPLTSPHTPLAVNRDWRGKSGLNNPYADLVMETDAVVGRVLAALEESGAADRTLVLFTSDNGCSPNIGAADLEKQGHFPSGPFRGYKSDVWEGGHRVPFLVRWPGVVRPGGVSRQPVHQADWMATLAEILGQRLPAAAGEDSFSLLPLLRGKDKPLRDHMVSQSIRGLLALRFGSWKLIFGKGSGGWTQGDDGLPGQLYNLDRDPGETINLFAEQPGTVRKLSRQMEKLVESGRSTPGRKQKNDVPIPWAYRMADLKGSN